jgi:phosphatidate cytidylyltransferase
VTDHSDPSDGEETTTPQVTKGPEGVRILGAEEAQAVIEGGTVGRRLGDDQPRFGDVPPRPDQSVHPTVSFPSPQTGLPNTTQGSRVEPPGRGAGPADEPSGPVPLPHWTEPPTGELPRILPEAEPVDVDENDDAWAHVSGLQPRFRSDASDWHDNGFAEGELSHQDDESLSAKAEPVDDDAVFEEQVALRRRRRSRATTGSAARTDRAGRASARARQPIGSTPKPDAAAAALGAAAAAEDLGTAPGGTMRIGSGPASGGAGLAGAVPAGGDPLLFDDEVHNPTPRGGMPVMPDSPLVRVMTGVVLLVIALVCFTLGAWVTAGLITVIVGLASFECFDALRHQGSKPATLLGVMGSIAMVVIAYNEGERAFPLVIGLMVVFTLLWYLIEVVRTRPVISVAMTFLGFMYVGVLGGFAGLILGLPQNAVGAIVGVALCAFAYDIFGYVVGSQFGKRPLFPAISPNKTIEGLVGGMLASVVVGVVIGAIHKPAPWATVKQGLALGLVVAVLAPLGDLCESMLKRDLGIKDFGAILPGHGGVLDRFDGVLFCLPGAYYLVLYLFF